MQSEYSFHARQRMNERGITEEEVENAIAFPDKVSHDKDTTVALKLRDNGHLLIVVFTETINTKKIITVIDTSKVEKYLQRYA